jgi:hypothetical protein
MQGGNRALPREKGVVSFCALQQGWAVAIVVCLWGSIVRTYLIVILACTAGTPVILGLAILGCAELAWKMERETLHR